MSKSDTWPSHIASESLSNMDSAGSCDSVISMNSACSEDSMEHLSPEERACLMFLEETIESIELQDDSGFSNEEPELGSHVEKIEQLRKDGNILIASDDTASDEKAILSYAVPTQLPHLGAEPEPEPAIQSQTDHQVLNHTPESPLASGPETLDHVVPPEPSAADSSISLSAPQVNAPVLPPPSDFMDKPNSLPRPERLKYQHPSVGLSNSKVGAPVDLEQVRQRAVSQSVNLEQLCQRAASRKATMTSLSDDLPSKLYFDGSQSFRPSSRSFSLPPVTSDRPSGRPLVASGRSMTLPPAASDPPGGLPPVASDPPSGLPPVASDPPSGLPPIAFDPPSGLPPVASDLPLSLSSVDSHPTSSLPSVDYDATLGLPSVVSNLPISLPPVDTDLPVSLPPVDTNLPVSLPPVDSDLPVSLPPVGSDPIVSLPSITYNEQKNLPPITYEEQRSFPTIASDAPPDLPTFIPEPPPSLLLEPKTPPAVAPKPKRLPANILLKSYKTSAATSEINSGLSFQTSGDRMSLDQDRVHLEALRKLGLIKSTEDDTSRKSLSPKSRRSLAEPSPPVSPAVSNTPPITPSYSRTNSSSPSAVRPRSMSPAALLLAAASIPPARPPPTTLPAPPTILPAPPDILPAPPGFSDFVDSPSPVNYSVDAAAPNPPLTPNTLLKQLSLPRVVGTKSASLERSTSRVKSILARRNSKEVEDETNPGQLRNNRPRPASLGNRTQFTHGDTPQMDVSAGSGPNSLEYLPSPTGSQHSNDSQNLPRSQGVSVVISPRAENEEDRREALKKLGLLRD